MDEEGKSNTKQQILCLKIDMKCKVIELRIINRESGARTKGQTHAIKKEWFRLCRHTRFCAYCSMVLHGPRGELHGGGGDGKRKKYSSRHCGTKF
jgi:hypothetical protein